jgi:hypothetical protein
MQTADDYDDGELVTIRQFGEMSEALAAQGRLESAGIDSFLADTNMARVDWPLTRGMRLQVEAEDAETAMALLEEPEAGESAGEP